MRVYKIRPGAIAPSGKWLFQRSGDSDSESDDDDNDDLDSDDDAVSYVSSSDSVIAMITAPGDSYPDPFRDDFNPNAVNPLLLAAARASARMPALRSLDFSLDPPMGRDHIIGRLKVSYKASRGESLAGWTRAEIGAAELLVESHPEFHLDREVMQAWREAAREHVGAKSKLEVTVKNPFL